MRPSSWGLGDSGLVNLAEITPTRLDRGKEGSTRQYGRLLLFGRGNQIQYLLNREREMLT